MKRFVVLVATLAVVTATALALGAPAAFSSPAHEPEQNTPSTSQPAAGMSLTSAFAVQNLENATATVDISFYNMDGTEATAAHISTQIAPLSLGNFAMPAALPFGWKGSVVVSSDRQVAAIGNLFGTNPEGFASFDGMGSGTAGYAGETGKTMYLPFILRERAGRNTTFGVQNAGTASTTVTITYYYLDGSVANVITKILQVGQSEIRQQKTDDTFLPTGFMGSVIATSPDQPLAAVVFDVTDGIIYSYNGIPSASTALYLPFMVRNRSDQNTAFFIQNTTDSTASVSVRYVGSAPSGAVDITHSTSLGPKGGWNQAQSSVPNLPDGFLGSATVTSSQPVVGIVNHSYGGFSAVGRKASYNAFVKGSKSISLPYVVRNRSQKTQGVIVQNMSDSATNVTFTFTPLAGGGNGSAFTKTVSVGPRGFWNFGTAWSDFAGMQDGAYGVATLTSTATDIVAIVNTWRIDNVSTDTLGSYNGINR